MTYLRDGVPPMSYRQLNCTTQFMIHGGQETDAGEYTENRFSPVRVLRRRLIREEIKEFFDADKANDEVLQADGLADAIVVLWGTMVAYWGVEKARQILAEVELSNLSKVLGVDPATGQRLPILDDGGKIQKPSNFQPPDIAAVLRG